jgi:hypothetical protein
MSFWIVLNTSPLPVGAPERIVVNHPGSKEAVISWLRTQNVLPHNVRYTIQGPLPTNDPTPMLLAVQPHLLNLSSAAVAAALSAPRGQAGQNAPDSNVDSMGFQRLGDLSLPVSTDEAVFGEVDDGTVTDIIHNGGSMVEQQRPKLKRDF